MKMKLPIFTNKYFKEIRRRRCINTENAELVSEYMKFYDRISQPRSISGRVGFITD